MNGKNMFFIMLLFTGLSCSGLAQGPVYDVPYVPTITEVVDVMLAMGEVATDDVLYDLGCGDGRIVITAAQRFGTRGVGIDINPDRIKESNRNARNAEVTDTVSFLNQNLFESDISEASVVTLYLLPAINLKLRPILFEQLKPGTRVVSHNYHMGEWDADAFKEVPSEYNTHYVYYWVVPANISGSWTLSITSGGSTKDYTLDLRQRFQNVNGMVAAGAVKRPVALFTLTGTDVAFSLDGELVSLTPPVKFVGKVEGDTMSGTMVTVNGQPSVTWTAHRNPGTMQPIHVSWDDK